jgi:outer membrane protein assembly factor BamB
MNGRTPGQKKGRAESRSALTRLDKNRIMEWLHHHHTREKWQHFWLSLIIFMLLVGACSGIVLLFHSSQPHANRHYLLTGQSVFAFEGGHTLWHHTLPPFKMSLPAMLLVEDHLYVAAGSVYALDKETGKQLWQQHIPFVGAFLRGFQEATALFWDNGSLYVKTDAQSLLRLDPRTGTMLWEYAEEEAEISPPAFSSSGEKIYVVTRQLWDKAYYEVTALNRDTRRQLWQQCFSLPPLPDQWGPVLAPLVQEDELLLVPLGNTVVPLRTTDGHLLVSSAHEQKNIRHTCG